MHCKARRDLLFSRHSLWTVAPKNFICVCVCVSVPLLWLTSRLLLGRISIKLGENIRTLVQLIILKFHKNQFSVDVIMT